MASVISASTTSATALNMTADTSGVLQIATGATPTTAIEIDASQVFKFNSGYGSVATAYGCRAWVNFNGTGTVAIRASGNVTSITDNGTGNYTVNFTTAMPDANYSVITGIGKGAIGVDDAIQGSARLAPITSTSSQQIGVVNATASAFIDSNYICLSIFR